jgi:hypothetical protein
MEFVNEIAAATWFHWVGGAMVGFTIGVWLDFLLSRAGRRR